MAQISVTPEELISQAEVYTQARDGIQEQIAKVEQMNNTIHEEWKGSAFEAYLAQYQELKSQVQKFEELLTNINSQLKKYAQTVQERDAADAKSFGLN
ncbi:hypothetical protein AUQ39_05035 [Lacticaseibacillus casei]|uniref:ESAT-6-like protein n=2 Tax=Lacticaseibacillus TaxID=2759736 RepID=A0ABY9L154_9LACO|nr:MULTISPECIES: WXG100 family type VII secretion target [Lacticaseibacillus]MDE3283261.1 WXG100 family type VII secretion target [Lacticaseibacillus casei]OLS09846.1 hypothetical protein AUQ39_05035 [Lacticaseibacillus casei]QVI31426.1 WXG100 family type VII secretion target [Lacticaseibacillus zeae]TLF42197.1 WXG100 family type VII secretion target [Lacticaseibacillus zeae]WLV77395.1 WXG100 family type VII secretion target [Lacticaseibacillus sp. NCIMB 15471]